MGNERKLFDRDLSAKVLSTTLESATSGVLAGIKAVALAHEQSIRSASILLEQAEAFAAQNREISEELVNNVKKYSTDIQNLYLDAFGNWVEGVKLPEVVTAAAPAPASSKKAAN